LFNLPVEMGSECNKDPDSHAFGYSSEGLFVVNPVELLEAFRNPLCFISLDVTVFPFQGVYPSSAEHMRAAWRLRFLPG
jgi:hypothetical protein